MLGPGRTHVPGSLRGPGRAPGPQAGLRPRPGSGPGRAQAQAGLRPRPGSGPGRASGHGRRARGRPGIRLRGGLRRHAPGQARSQAPAAQHSAPSPAGVRPDGSPGPGQCPDPGDPGRAGPGPCSRTGIAPGPRSHSRSQAGLRGPGQASGHGRRAPGRAPASCLRGEPGLRLPPDSPIAGLVPCHTAAVSGRSRAARRPALRRQVRQLPGGRSCVPSPRWTSLSRPG